MVINMCEYNNVPKIRFKGFTDVWEQRKLGEIINETIDNRGKNPPYYCESGIPIIDNFMIKNNGYPDLKIATRYLDDYLFSNFIRKYNEKDDVLITLVGNGIGNIALFPKEKSAIVQNTIGMRFEHPKKFKYYSLLSKNNEIVKLDRGMAQPSIRQDELKNLDINLPTEKEQSKIESLMTNLDNLITLHQRKCDTLVNAKKSLLEKMFPKNSSNIPEIRFKGFTDVWEQRKLGEIGNTFTGLSGKTKEDFGHGEAKFVTYMNVFSNPIAQFNKTEPIEIDNKQNQVEYGDVFFTTSSETPDEVGMSSVWLENKGNIYLNSFCFGFRPFVKNDPYYMAYMLRSKNFRKNMTLLAQGISRYNISKNGVMNIDIQLPINQEQEKIGKLFYEIDNLITLHQRKLEKLKNIKKSMLDKMFV